MRPIIAGDQPFTRPKALEPEEEKNKEKVQPGMGNEVWLPTRSLRV